MNIRLSTIELRQNKLIFHDKHIFIFILYKDYDTPGKHCHFFMHFCPGTMTTHAESIDSDLQRGLLDRRLRHTQH